MICLDFSCKWNLYIQTYIFDIVFLVLVYPMNDLNFITAVFNIFLPVLMIKSSLVHMM